VARETALTAWDEGDSMVAESPVKGSSCTCVGEREDGVVTLGIWNDWVGVVSLGGPSGMDTGAMVGKGR
jgi:hypothetical protein